MFSIIVVRTLAVTSTSYQLLSVFIYLALTLYVTGSFLHKSGQTGYKENWNTFSGEVVLKATPACLYYLDPSMWLRPVSTLTKSLFRLIDWISRDVGKWAGASASATCPFVLFNHSVFFLILRVPVLFEIFATYHFVSGGPFRGLWTLYSCSDWLMWRVVLTWSICMLLLGKSSKCMNIKKDFFSFMAVLLSEAQTEIPAKSVNHTNLTYHRLRRSYFNGAIMLRSLCVRRKRSYSYHARPSCPVIGNSLLLSVSESYAKSAGSQSGSSACSVLCTSSGRSFGLLFAWPG